MYTTRTRLVRGVWRCSSISRSRSCCCSATTSVRTTFATIVAAAATATRDMAHRSLWRAHTRTPAATAATIAALPACSARHAAHASVYLPRQRACGCVHNSRSRSGSMAAAALCASRRGYSQRSVVCRQQQQHNIVSGSGSSTPAGAALRAGEYACSACGKSFRLLNALHHHIQTKHAGQATAMRRVDGVLVEVTSNNSSGSDASTSSSAAAGHGSTASNVTTSAAPVSFASVLSPFPLGTAAAATSASTSTAAARAGDEADGSSSSNKSTDESLRRQFVCSICAKPFRIEAALQHHYQAKHGMDMPAATTTAAATTAPPPPAATSVGNDGDGDGSSSSASGAAYGAAATTAATASDATSSHGNGAAAGETAALSSAYVRQAHDAAALPHAAQYHTAVAPNAPEEADVAVHACCVNRAVLLGVVCDVQTGYVFSDKVLQFSVVTAFVAPAAGEPDTDVHTVRVYGEQYWQALRPALHDGARCVVTGRLRLVPQYEATLHKYFHFPVVQVTPGSGSVVPV